MRYISSNSDLIARTELLAENECSKTIQVTFNDSEIGEYLFIFVSILREIFCRTI